MRDVKYLLPSGNLVWSSLGREDNHEDMAHNKAVWCRELGSEDCCLLLFLGMNLAR